MRPLDSGPISKLFLFFLLCIRNEALSASTASRNDYLKDIQKKVLLDVLELKPSIDHKNRYRNIIYNIWVEFRNRHSGPPSPSPNVYMLTCDKYIPND